MYKEMLVDYKFLRNAALTFFVGYFTLPAGYGQNTNCLTAKNESAQCVPSEFCGITLNLTKTATVSGLNVRQLSVRYCGTLVSTAYVCCPLPHIIASSSGSKDCSCSSQTADVLESNLNPKGLEMLKSTECGHIDEAIFAIGVKETKYSKFPWIVYLKGNGGWQDCTGALITDQHVLTTAMCLNLKIITKVHFGYTSVDVFDVETSYIHPKFNSYPIKAVAKSNIAIIRLNRKVKLNSYIMPICLPLSSTLANYTWDNGVFVAGKSEEETTQTLTIPQGSDHGYFNVPPVNTAISSVYTNISEVSVDCRNKDGCNFIDGTPLFYPATYSQTTRYVQFGVMWKSSSSNNMDITFTKISPYIIWITNVIQL